MPLPVKIAYADFWGSFDPRDNFFTRLLAPHFDLQLSADPEFLIYSCFGRTHRRFNCTRIFYTGENCRPDFGECDYAFSFDHDDRAQHCRWPLYASCGDPAWLIKRQPIDVARLLAEKTEFCNFVYSNRRCKLRIEFFKELSKYKRVDSGGRLLNNIGGPIGDKHSFLRKYKFTIAFENSSYPGYTTEKLVQAMYAESLPIYWGNPLVHLDFNPRSFINFHDFGSLDALIERVIEVDRDDSLYAEYLQQPWYYGNEPSPCARPETILARFAEIFSQPARRRVPRRWLAAMWG